MADPSPDIVKQIPWQLSNYSGSPNSGGYNLKDYSFDYALGGIPFLSATRDQWPYTEGMAEIRKQQFDASAEPGEQSIYGWWLRSQNSWTSGAGIVYQDPDVVNPYVRSFDLRFDDSLGVDNWSSGQVSLLKQPDLKFTVASQFSRVRGYVDPSGIDAAFYLDGNTLYKITDTGRIVLNTGSTGTVLGLANAGTTYILLATDGIWAGVDTAAGVKLWNAPAGTFTTGAIEYTKNRITAAWGNTLYILPMTGGPTLPTTQPTPSTGTAQNNTGLVITPASQDAGWQWTSIAEGPSGIYVSGKNSTQSLIYIFQPDLSSNVEVFIPTVTATLPRGEWVNAIFSYVGTFMGIATNKGFRVGDLGSSGDVHYGPLLFQPSGGCNTITGQDRFMYVGSTNAHDGATGLYRVDLGTPYQEQSTNVVRYAYARDIYAPARVGQVQSVSILGASGRLVFTVQGDSIWIQNATTLYPSGYIKTGRIRLNTEEPKLYKFMSVSSPNPLQGNLSLSVIDIKGNEYQSITYGPNLNPGTSDVTISQPAGPQKWIKLKFTLSRGTDVTTGAILNGWQVKALPGSIRQRMISHTFLLFDEEKDKSGQRVGNDTYARQRFEQFKELARAGDVVTFQDLYEDLSVLVVIDDWKYTQLAPPGPGGGTLGGYLTVVLRTVAEST